MCRWGKLHTGLHERPAGRPRSKQRPGGVAQLAVDLAIAAAEEEQEHIVRQLLHAVLIRIRHLDVESPVVLDEGIVAQRDAGAAHHMGPWSHPRRVCDIRDPGGGARGRSSALLAHPDDVYRVLGVRLVPTFYIVVERPAAWRADVVT